MPNVLIAPGGVVDRRRRPLTPQDYDLIQAYRGRPVSLDVLGPPPTAMETVGALAPLVGGALMAPSLPLALATIPAYHAITSGALSNLPSIPTMPGEPWLTLADLVTGAGGKGAGETQVAGFSKRRVRPQRVTEAEALLRGLDPEDEMMLYHSGTRDIDKSIRENWLTPQVGEWVRETLSGATDDPDLIEDLSSVDRGVVYMSDVPDWVRVKVARKLGKHVKDVTAADVQQHGQLTMIRTDKDAPIVRKLEDEEYVQNLRGERQRWWESDLYDYDTRRDIPFGVERGDYFAVRDIEPTTTLTGEALLRFLQRNYPTTLSNLTKKKK